MLLSLVLEEVGVVVLLLLSVSSKEVSLLMARVGEEVSLFSCCVPSSLAVFAVPVQEVEEVVGEGEGEEVVGEGGMLAGEEDGDAINPAKVERWIPLSDCCSVIPFHDFIC